MKSSELLIKQKIVIEIEPDSYLHKLTLRL